jgi:GMP synthase-like glutamine amidotransferase
VADASWWCLQHLDPEGPGAIAPALARRGTALRVCRPDLGEPLPAAADVAGLVVMGGPMHALDDTAHPHLAAERALIAEVVVAGRPVLGVCLGAQLLAAAVGGSVRRGAAAENGFGTVALTAAGRTDPVLGPAPAPLPVVHWHEDAVVPPPGVEPLASTPLCACQAFRVGPVAYGLQFHVELSRADRGMLAAEMPPGTAPSPEQLDAVAAAGAGVLDRFVDRALAGRPAPAATAGAPPAGGAPPAPPG